MTKGELKRLFEDSRDVILAAGLPETGPGRAFLKAIEARRNEVRTAMETTGRMSEIIREDFRFQAGVISALNEVLRMPTELRDYINRNEGELQ